MCGPENSISENLLTIGEKTKSEKGITMNRAVFLDRDGVVNKLCYHRELKIKCAPFTANEFKMVLGVPEAVNLIHQSGYLCILIYNQPDVGLGLMMPDDFKDIKLKMRADLARSRAYLDGEYYCMHHPDAVIDEYKRICDCRKPKPGLLLRAALDHHVDLPNSWFVGDYLSDVEAGKGAGCRTILIEREKLASHCLASNGMVVPDKMCSNLVQG
jgi:D-glycero-D-manno-heptose 1,7-bisphosphate phosphatase